MKKKIIVFTTLGIIITVFVVSLIFLLSVNKKDYASIINDMKNDGYEFSYTKSDMFNMEDIVILNDSDKIMIEKAIHYQSNETTYTFMDYSIASESNISLSEINPNDYKISINPIKKHSSSNGKKQYESYKEWLKKYNLNEKTVIKLIDYYQKSTKPDKVY